jgi:hypothetical protein
MVENLHGVLIKPDLARVHVGGHILCALMGVVEEGLREQVSALQNLKDSSKVNCLITMKTNSMQVLRPQLSCTSSEDCQTWEIDHSRNPSITSHRASAPPEKVVVITKNKALPTLPLQTSGILISLPLSCTSASRYGAITRIRTLVYNTHCSNFSQTTEGLLAAINA